MRAKESTVQLIGDIACNTGGCKTFLANVTCGLHKCSAALLAPCAATADCSLPARSSRPTDTLPVATTARAGGQNSHISNVTTPRDLVFPVPILRIEATSSIATSPTNANVTWQFSGGTRREPAESSSPAAKPHKFRNATSLGLNAKKSRTAFTESGLVGPRARSYGEPCRGHLETSCGLRESVSNVRVAPPSL